MGSKVRPAEAADMENCAALYKHIYDTTYRGVVEPRVITSVQQEDSVARLRAKWLDLGAEMYVAEDVQDEAEPVFLGYVYGLPSPDVLGAFWLESLYLNEAARGMGLGKRLIEMMKDTARNQGYQQMVIDVFTGNDAAEQIYEHLGAVHINDDYIEDVNDFPVQAKLLIWDL